MFQPKKPKIDVLHERSESVISVFTQTVTSLKTINEEIVAHRLEKEAHKAEIESHIQKLDSREKANTAVIANIEKIFA